jgi:hypothetical protein
MAYYFIFPEKDTTLYSHPDRDNLNTGHDEILEIVKERGTTNDFYYPSRALIKFKNEEITNVISNVIGQENFTNTKVNLQLYSAEPRNIIQTLNLNAYALSSSWDEGTGRYSNIPTSSNGASWIYRFNSSHDDFWIGGQTEIAAITFNDLMNEAGSGVDTSSLQYDAYGASGSIYLFNTTGDEFTLHYTSSVVGAGDLKIPITDISGTLVGIDVSGSHPVGSPSMSANELAKATAYTIGELGPLSASFSASYVDNVVTVVSLITGSQVDMSTTFNEILWPAGLNWNILGAINILQVTNSISPARQGYKDSFIAGTTGSIDTTLFNGTIDDGGGNWWTGSDMRATQQFLVGESLDIDMDVTSTVKLWSSSIYESKSFPDGIENHGFLLKQPDVIEEDVTSSFGEMQYFSVDTHTIYPPRLSFKWDDSSFPNSYTSSFAKLGTDPLQVSLINNKEEYNQNSQTKFNIHVRKQYPTRQFASSSNYLHKGYFATSSHYSIRDAYTEEEVIPFDHNYTKLSADSSGMYFKLYMKGLQPERYYRILIRHIDEQGNTTIYDDNNYFKVVR